MRWNCYYNRRGLGNRHSPLATRLLVPPYLLELALVGVVLGDGAQLLLAELGLELGLGVGELRRRLLLEQPDLLGLKEGQRQARQARQASRAPSPRCSTVASTVDRVPACTCLG